MADSESNFDVIVIGAGPGGYVAAIRASQNGLKTAVVESRGTLGGTCLNVGCIPSKALLHTSELFEKAQHQMAGMGIVSKGVSLDLKTMMGHKDATVNKLTGGVEYLFKKNKIHWEKGLGKLKGNGQVEVTGEGGKTTTLTGKHIIIATGSSPSSIPGVELDGRDIVTSDEAIAFDKVPKEMVVIGVELGSVWSRLGSKVTLLEFLPQVLGGFDNELAKTAQRFFGKQGLTFVLNARVQKAEVKKTKVHVTYQDKDGKEQTVTADKVLVATGRRPHTDGLGADEAGLELDEKGRVIVDENFRTNLDGVYAIGDVIRGPMLAHKAEDEGVAVADLIATGHGHVDYDAIPSIVYTWPEVAFVGKTEEQLKEAGIPYKKGKFNFTANGRAIAMGDTDGFVKVLAHQETDRLLGVHVIGPAGGDLVAEATVAMGFQASAEDLAMICHAHPTLSEVVKEAALAVDKRQIHS